MVIKKVTPLVINRVKGLKKYVDKTLDLTTDYLSHKYGVDRQVKKVKKEIEETVHKLKIQIFKSTVEMFFLATGILSLMVGFAIFLSRTFPLENILLGYGIVVTILLYLKVKNTIDDKKIF
jgi:hypothetical protein